MTVIDDIEKALADYDRIEARTTWLNDTDARRLVQIEEDTQKWVRDMLPVVKAALEVSQQYADTRHIGNLARMTILEPELNKLAEVVATFEGREVAKDSALIGYSEYD